MWSQSRTSYKAIPQNCAARVHTIPSDTTRLPIAQSHALLEVGSETVLATFIIDRVFSAPYFRAAFVANIDARR